MRLFIRMKMVDMHLLDT